MTGTDTQGHDCRPDLGVERIEVLVHLNVTVDVPVEDSDDLAVIYDMAAAEIDRRGWRQVCMLVDPQ